MQSFRWCVDHEPDARLNLFSATPKLQIGSHRYLSYGRDGGLLILCGRCSEILAGGYAEDLQADPWVAHVQALSQSDLKHSRVLTFHLPLTDLAVVGVLHLAENCLVV
ncbi:hypothetical protein EMCRGX_G005542 [Ephydatia muelleri]